MRVYTARWLLPVASPPVRDGAVAVDPDGRLAYVGPAGGAPPGDTTALGNAALLPGFVAVLSRPRPDTLLRAAAAGVTTLAAVAPNPTTLDALLASDLRAVVYHPFVGPTPACRAPALAALHRDVAALRARITAAHATARIRVGITPRDMPHVDEDLLIDACAWAVGESLPLAIPAGRSAAEVAFLREASGPIADARRAAGLDVVRRAHSTIHLLAELGIAAVARPLLLGGAFFGDSDVALAAYYDCPVAYERSLEARPTLPTPVAALRDAGAHVALAAAAPLATAAPLARSPDEALSLATLGAARALDLGDDTGSLEVGKSADLCAFAFSDADLRLADTHGPAHALLSMPTRRPFLTVVAGYPRQLQHLA